MKSIRFIFYVLCLLGWLGLPALGQPVHSEFMEYDITWIGLSVGTMTVQGETDETGRIVRSVRIWNRPWIAAIYPVDTTVACVIEQTPQGPRHVVIKKVVENDFKQDDTLILLPDQGSAIWSNTLNHTVRTSTVPKGSRDLVSFFFDLRDAAGGGRLKASGDYQLVMDGTIHELEITSGPPKSIRTPYGRMEAILVTAVSKSPTLFDRNKPRAVWVDASRPEVIFADVQSRFGAVRATLVKWEIDGVAVPLKPAPPGR
jgi:hypothetical protein